MVNDELTDDKSIIANGFCSYYHSAVSNLKATAFKLVNFTWVYRENLPGKINTRFRFNYVSVPQIKRHLKNLKVKKSPGIDNIPNKFLKDFAPICHLINVIISTSTVPIDFKTGKITPVYKSEEKDLLKNYRPITMLPVVSKIMERCMYDQLINYLETNNLFSSRQFGFRKRRSTESAATLLVDNIHRAMDKSQLTGAIFIDLSKAFDTVSHSSIISKLPSYGIVQQEKELLTDYLFNRWQYVQYKGILSSKLPVYCGVPQGSILGPLLFLLHFNDAEKQLENCSIITYADDTVIYFHDKNIDKIADVLTKDFERLSNWLEKNELSLNLKKGKTELMVFGTKIRLSRITDKIQIKHQFNEINSTSSYKYLGVLVDPSLNLDDHFKNVYKKASSRVRLLRKIRNNLTTDAALRIYQAYVMPTVLYCSLVNYFHQPYRQKMLEIMENRAKNIINHQSKTFPSLNIEHEKKVCINVRKSMENDLECFSDYFEIINHTIKTRNNSYLLRIPRVKLESSKKTFFYTGAVFYNRLPLDIRKESMLENFVKKVKSIQ